MGAGAGAAAPGCVARGAGGVPGVGARADPVWADARLAVHVLPRGGVSDGVLDLSDGARSGLHAQLCGDAHLSNFGAYAAPDRRLVFSLNDFDETLPGPFEWDVKRLVASFAVAGRDRGFDTKTRSKINAAVSAAYRDAMQSYAGMRTLDIWYDRVDLAELLPAFDAMASAEQKKRLDKNLAKARTKDSLAAFNKLTETVDGEPRIIGNPPLIVPIDELAGPGKEEQDRVQEGSPGVDPQLPADARGRPAQADRAVPFRRCCARKVVGVGSVGTRAWIVLMLGRDGDDPLFLQAKEAQTSVLEPFLGHSEFANHGQRVVEGQRLMQAASDIMLGWLHTTGFDGEERDFYIRQLWDAKGSALVELMEPNAMLMYAQVCGRTLAKGHARSGDPIAIASYLGTSEVFDKAMAAFAEAYADQNERDYATLKQARNGGSKLDSGAAQKPSSAPDAARAVATTRGGVATHRSPYDRSACPDRCSLSGFGSVSRGAGFEPGTLLSPDKHAVVRHTRSALLSPMLTVSAARSRRFVQVVQMGGHEAIPSRAIRTFSFCWSRSKMCV